MSGTLEERRVNQGMSRRDLADEAKVALETVRLVEGGRRPTPSVGKKLADVFGCKYTDLWPLDETSEVPA